MNNKGITDKDILNWIKIIIAIAVLIIVVKALLPIIWS